MRPYPTEYAEIERTRSPLLQQASQPCSCAPAARALTRPATCDVMLVPPAELQPRAHGGDAHARGCGAQRRAGEPLGAHEGEQALKPHAIANPAFVAEQLGLDLAGHPA